MIAWLKRKTKQQPKPDSSLRSYPLKISKKEPPMERGDMSKPIRHAHANLESRGKSGSFKDKSENKKTLK